MPYISIVVPTYRVGGIDILLDALAAQSYTDFELVLSDMLYKYRARQVQEEARKRFLKVVHVEPKPNLFPVASFCACANTGLAAASGDVVLFMVDYSAPPADLVAKHADHHHRIWSPHVALMGPHQYVKFEADFYSRYYNDQVDEYSRDIQNGQLGLRMISAGKVINEPCEPWIVDGGNTAYADADPKLRLPAGPLGHHFFHAKNESVRTEYLLDANGWDEALDGAHGYQDTDLATRLAKLGVTWTLDPTCVNMIANPRNVFPMLRRERTIQDNEKIVDDNVKNGLKRPNKYDLRARRKQTLMDLGAGVVGLPPSSPSPAPGSAFSSRSASEVARKLRVAMIYGEFSSAIHGPFDFSRLGDAALTGSEGSFFNLARTLAERGHQIVVLAPAVASYVHASGAHMLPLRPTIEALPQMQLDAVVSWNEPDYLQFSPPGVARIVDQQLNDWGYCSPKWQDLVDVLVFPSESSRQNHANTEHIAKANDGVIIPNSVDLDLFDGVDPPRHPHTVIWCSSPDRGLHHLLSFWPAVRARVSDAKLKIFYRLQPWLEANRDNANTVGARARFVADALRRLTNGWGIEVVGPVSNHEMAEQLRMAAVLAYPCDPVRYTEGFGCSVLDACAAGCIPIISDADALAEVHGGASVVISGRPEQTIWVEEIVHALQVHTDVVRNIAASAHALTHSRQKVAEQWERLLSTVSTRTA